MELCASGNRPQAAMKTRANNDERSTGELFHDLSEQSSRLIHQEVALAQAELIQKGAQAGIGIGLLGGAGILVLYGLGALTAGAILLLSTAVNGWIAAVIVAGGFLIVAATAAIVGRARLARSGPALPKTAIETTRHDVETIRASIHEGRS